MSGLEEVALPPALAAFACRNNRLAEMALATDGFAEAVGAARERYGAERIAVVPRHQHLRHRGNRAGLPPPLARTAPCPPISTTSAPTTCNRSPRYVRARLGLRGPALAISTACTSGARSFLEAAVLIEAGLADAVVVGGVDTLCRMTLQGFASLELLSRGPCRPCAADRDGISIGEAAGLALLERADGRADAGLGRSCSAPAPAATGTTCPRRTRTGSAPSPRCGRRSTRPG